MWPIFMGLDRCRIVAGKKYREHLLEIRLCFEITSLASIHCSGLRKLNNFCSIVTLGLETKVLTPNQMVAFSPAEAGH